MSVPFVGEITEFFRENTPPEDVRAAIRDAKKGQRAEAPPLLSLPPPDGQG